MEFPNSCSSSPWPDKESVLSGNKRKRAIQELVQGRDCATQLQLLLLHPQHASVSAPPPPHRDQLLLSILKSFSHTLSVLTSTSDNEDPSPLPPLDLSPVGSACSDDRRSQDSGDHTTKTPDKRGCYKRRKNVETWTTITTTTEDGQAWRKYGQKDILNAKYPRAYFRCTRKYDQGCRATKQVQMMEDDSNLYKTTYIGRHTCTRDMLKPPQLISDSDPNANDDHSEIHFTTSGHHQEHAHQTFTLTSTHMCRVKEESKEPGTTGNGNILTFDSISWPDVLSFDSSEAVSMVYSCTDTSSHSLDLDLVVNSVGFDTDFNFDESEFL